MTLVHLDYCSLYLFVWWSIGLVWSRFFCSSFILSFLSSFTVRQTAHVFVCDFFLFHFSLMSACGGCRHVAQGSRGLNCSIGRHVFVNGFIGKDSLAGWDGLTARLKLPVMNGWSDHLMKKSSLIRLFYGKQLTGRREFGLTRFIGERCDRTFFFYSAIDCLRRDEGTS